MQQVFPASRRTPELLIIVTVLLHILLLPVPTTGFSMTWADTWDDILNGGNTRWKVTDPSAKQTALNHIVQSQQSNGSPLNILCPLAGDDSFVKYAWEQGHCVTAIDLVPSAVAAMRAQFGNDDTWTSSTSGPMVVWKHNSKRATLYEGDVLYDLQELHGTIGLVWSSRQTATQATLRTSVWLPQTRRDGVCGGEKQTGSKSPARATISCGEARLDGIFRRV